MRGPGLTVLPAGTSNSLLQFVGEVGLDLSAWASGKQFTAWLGLARGSYQSGKRSRGPGRKRNRAGRLLCVMMRSLARSKDMALGGFYRRMAARRGGPVTPLARFTRGRSDPKAWLCREGLVSQRRLRNL